MTVQNITSILPRAASLSAAIALIVATSGCDKPMTASAPPSKPASAAIEMKIDNQPDVETAAVSMLPPSVISVDSREVTFPGAKLAIISRGAGGITLRICSDDPPTAIDPGYLGNSYLFDMQLAIDRISDLPAARWDRKASDAGDSTSGIFIHGYRNALLPADLHVTFEKSADELLTYITGTCTQDDNQNPGAPPKQVQINACLHTPMPTE